MYYRYLHCSTVARHFKTDHAETVALCFGYAKTPCCLPEQMNRTIVPQVKSQWLLLYATLRYSTLLYATLRYSTLLYATLRYSTLLYATLRYSTLLYATLRYSTLSSRAVLQRQGMQKTVLKRQGSLAIFPTSAGSNCPFLCSDS
jgi:hypothetical protein